MWIASSKKATTISSPLFSTSIYEKIFTYSFGALFLASALSLGSCKSQADDDLTRRTEQSINQGKPVVFTFDMESLPEQDARALSIESQTANGKNAGIKMTWAKRRYGDDPPYLQAGHEDGSGHDHDDDRWLQCCLQALRR